MDRQRPLHPGAERPERGERQGSGRLNSGARPPMPSADSFRPVPPGQEGDVYHVILAVEQRLALKLDQQTTELRAEFDERLRAVEDAMREAKDARLEFRAANQKLDALLASDARQTQDILSLQQRKETTQIADASAQEASSKVAQTVGRKLNWRTAIIGVLAVLLSKVGGLILEAILRAANQ